MYFNIHITCWIVKSPTSDPLDDSGQKAICHCSPIQWWTCKDRFMWFKLQFCFWFQFLTCQSSSRVAVATAEELLRALMYLRPPEFSALVSCQSSLHSCRRQVLQTWSVCPFIKEKIGHFFLMTIEWHLSCVLEYLSDVKGCWGHRIHLWDCFELPRLGSVLSSHL